MSMKEQLGPMLRLAIPLIVAELGWMAMGLVDTVMIGHMDHPVLAIASAALGQVLYNTIAFGIAGVLLGLDTYLSQSHGAGRFEEAGRWLLHGLVLAAGLALVLAAVVGAAPRWILRMPIDRAVLAGAVTFLGGLNWGTPALFLYFALRRYLQAFNHVRPIAIALVSANALNATANWLLIYGHHWGALSIPAYGILGSAVSSSLARVYLAGYMVVAVLCVDRRHGYGLRALSPRLERILVWRLASLGAPAGAQILVEIAIFAAVTFAIGVLGPLPLAGHEIALNCAGFTFMVPFAISAAAAVRVGQAIGRKSPGEAASAGWAAIALGAGCMAAMGLVLVTLPLAIAAAFTPNPAVIAATVPLLYVAAAFQFFDGLQIAATGSLRGAGNTHAGLIVQSIGYWGVGLPIGWWLGFRMHLGALGLWIGLCVGLMVAGVALTAVWARTTKQLRQLP